MTTYYRPGDLVRQIGKTDTARVIKILRYGRLWVSHSADNFLMVWEMNDTELVERPNPPRGNHPPKVERVE